MCQGCVNSGYLSQETHDKIQEFAEKYPDSEYGPAHIVIGDDNVLDGHLVWCLGLIKAALSGNPKDLFHPADIKFMDGMGWYKDDSRETLVATKAFLEELLATPEEDR